MLGILLTATILISGATPDACDLDCERKSAVLLIENGETRAAIDLLKRARDGFPDDRHLILLLAGAYPLENTLFPEDRAMWAVLRANTDPWWNRSIPGAVDAGSFRFGRDVFGVAGRNGLRVRSPG